MENSSLDRRQLFRRSALLAGAAATLPSTSSANHHQNHSVKLKKGDLILFQGDSITDAGRNKRKQSDANSPEALGNGYPLFTASGILGSHPSLGLRVLNRGISGHKVPDLQKRWQKDTIDLQPAVLSILIGVNDIWHKLNGKSDGTVASYQSGFAELLKQTKAALPNTKIVICEPFVTRCGAVKDNWFPEFDQRRAAAREVANTAGAIWVPFQKMFDDAIAAGTTPEHWAHDGVHPTFAGHSLMAQTWRKTVGI
ncbi:MAG: SGNH/GDSL hydrolase family protein [Verrucomicrobiaceae bacterium]